MRYCVFTSSNSMIYLGFFRVRKVDFLNSSKMLLAGVHRLPRLPGIIAPYTSLQVFSLQADSLFCIHCAYVIKVVINRTKINQIMKVLILYLQIKAIRNIILTRLALPCGIFDSTFILKYSRMYK
jgi:hypothetical protein